MANCNKCGAEIPLSAKFCIECGAPIDDTKESYRNSKYAGDIRKCPACGEEIPSFTAICPACGHEINSSEVTDSLREFILELEKIDQKIELSPKPTKKGWSTWSKWQKIGWVVLNIFTYCIPLVIYLVLPLIMINNKQTLSAEEKRKATFIQNYTFPNEREAILEALFL